MEVIRPPVVDIILSCDGENIATTNQIHIGIITTTHAWGDDRGRARSTRGSRHFCRYIHLKRKRVSSNAKLILLKIVIAL